MEATRIANDGLSIRKDGYEDERESTLVNVLWALEDVDTYMYGEEFCIGNCLGMAISLYDCNRVLTFTLPLSMLDNLSLDDDLCIYGTSPTAEERVEIERSFKS